MEGEEEEPGADPRGRIEMLSRRIHRNRGKALVSMVVLEE